MTASTVIGYGNLIDSATLSGGDWATGGAASTLNNLKTRYLRQLAVSDGDGTSAAQFTIDLGSEKTIGLIALINHNITVGTGQITLTGSNNSGFTEIAWRGNNMLAYAGGDFAVALPDDIAARYWKVEISDTSNAANYISIGRVFIGPAFAPLQGLEFGSSVGVESRSGINEAWSGMEHFEQRRNRRVWRGQFNYLLEAEANEWLALCRTNDVSGEVYILEQTERTCGNLLMSPDAIGSWGVGGLSASANTTADPLNGATVADTLTETAITDYHQAFLVNSLYLAGSGAAANDVTFSCYVKNNSSRFIVLSIADTPTYSQHLRGYFNTSTRASIAYNAGAATSMSGVSCSDAGNGWVRVSITGKLNFAGASKPDLTLYFDDVFNITLQTYTGNTDNNMIFWGAMVNFGSVMDYVDASRPMTVDSSGYRGSRSFLGRLRSLSPIEWPYINRFSTAIEVSEVL